MANIEQIIFLRKVNNFLGHHILDLRKYHKRQDRTSWVPTSHRVTLNRGKYLHLKNCMSLLEEFDKVEKVSQLEEFNKREKASNKPKENSYHSYI